jgi:hypothetical protein
MTTPNLTKYERARILGARALQIRLILFLLKIMFFSLCAPLMVNPGNVTDPLLLADMVFFFFL